MDDSKIELPSKHIWSLTAKVLKEEKDLKKIQPYLDSLEAGLLKPDIKNIALTGDYGSGKSTILGTFQDQHPEFKCLNLSLASFKEEGEGLEEKLDELEDQQRNEASLKQKGKVENKLENLNRLIEVSILQQIIYQASPEEIPDSRFQRILGVSNEKLIRFAIGSVIWLISIIILFKYEGLKKANPDNWTYIFEDLSLSSAIAIPIFFIGIGYLMFRIGRVFSNSRITKINIKGELELGKDLNKSILNKHLDEILYFFEQTKFNVVIIEDLDRFKNTEVFTKLREINLLLNKSVSIIKQNRKIVFIYAIRDEMFENSERVKFFDYIIPVIPFINPTNAKDQFYNLLKVEQLEHELDSEFIEDVVTYINDIDMRLLTNVFQEFSIYKKQMGSGILLENLFALILYKNLYPKDFTQLPKREGNLFKFFDKKKNYTKKLIDDISLDIAEIKLKINNIEKEKITNIKELNAIYISAIKEETDAFEILIENWTRFNNLYKDDYFEKLIELGEFSYKTRTYNTNSRYYTSNVPPQKNLSFKTIESKVNEQYTYSERKSFIENKADNSVEELKISLSENQYLKKDIELWNIQQIFENININTYLGKFKNKELLGNLLTNGYIDENYIEYITLFHEAKITLLDKQFIKKVKSGQVSNYDYYLSQPYEIIKEIPNKYFSRTPILNYYILGFILRWEDDDNGIKRELLIRQICDIKSGTKDEYDMFNFVDGYINYHSEAKEEYKLHTSGSIPEFINILSSQTGLLWNSLFRSSAPQQQIHKYLRLVITHADPKGLASNSQISTFKNYIKQNSQIINLFNSQSDSQKLATLIETLNIKFLDLVSRTEDNKMVFDFIHRHNYYQLSSMNIKAILVNYSSKYNPTDDKLINTSNYSYIQLTDCDNLKDYVEENINFYVENVLLRLSENTNESEQSIIYLLNHEKVKEGLKISLIEKQKTKISDASELLNYDSTTELIEHEKIQVSWSNIFLFFKESGKTLTPILINYLNKEHILKELIKTDIPDSLSNNEELEQEFFVSIIKCNKLSSKSYLLLIKCFPEEYSSWNWIGFNQLDEIKVGYLIKENFLSLNQKIFDSLNENFPSLKANYLVKKRFLVKHKLEKEELVLEDKDQDIFFNSDDVENSIKENIIKSFARQRILSDKNIAKLTGSIVSEYKRNYLTYDEMNAIFTLGNNTILEKINILNNHFHTLEIIQIKNLVIAISKDHENIFDTSKRAKFSATGEMKLLADNLKDKKLIKNYSLQKEDTIIRIYPI